MVILLSFIISEIVHGNISKRNKLSMNETSIDEINTVNYLGVEITNNKILSKEVRDKMTKSHRISRLLNDMIFNNKHMSTEPRIRASGIKVPRKITGYSLIKREMREPEETSEVYDVVRWTKATKAEMKQPFNPV